MAQARVVILNEARIGDQGKWNLCFQWCRYEYGDESEENGYRFVWRDKDGKIKGLRGGARIPSIAEIMELISVAIKEGWGHHIAN